MLPSTAERVPLHTAETINERIRRETLANVTRSAQAISGAVWRLDYEWDIERVLEANAASVILVGMGLSLFVSRKFMVIPAIAAGFLLQHALQGWCPPVELFRRLGVRTAREIEWERNALKALRGDYREVGPGSGEQNAQAAFAAASR